MKIDINAKPKEVKKAISTIQIFKANTAVILFISRKTASLIQLLPANFIFQGFLKNAGEKRF